MSYLTAVMQFTAREKKLPLDNVSIFLIIIKIEK